MTATAGFGNLQFTTIAAAGTFTIPQGFMFASITPNTGASFTITNSRGDQYSVSGAITVSTSFPLDPNARPWDAHIITATGGSVEVEFYTGN